MGSDSEGWPTSTPGEESELSTMEREVVLEGPFDSVAQRDAVFANGTVTVEGKSYRVAVTISGQDHFFLTPLDDGAREEARGWFALMHLISVPLENLTPPGPRLLSELKVGIPSGPSDRHQWATIEQVREFKDRALPGHETAYRREAASSKWSARPISTGAEAQH